MVLPSRLLGMLPALFVLLWSTGFIGAKYGLPYADPLAFLVARYALVIVALSLLAWAGKAVWITNPAQLLHLAIAGLLLQATYLGGVFIAISHGLPAGLTSLLVGLQPLLTALLAGILLGETVGKYQWLGIATGLLGVVLVLAQKAGVATAHNLSWYEVTPALFALLGITFGTLYQKRFCPHFDLRTGSVVQFVPSLIITALLVPVMGEWHIEWTGHFLFALGWQVIVLSLGAISLLNLLIRQQGAINITSLFYLTPAVTTLIAWVLFDEVLTLQQWLGMALTMLGVWLVRRNPLAKAVSR
ncbi:DMT family transporter [Thiothrix lacustris]|uniref:DMT family transporter n=1 Tax=Thiothrix lacustris TaxID=525917 RepID=UPI0027E40362|nr:DMT family transporter [Thiothrix lacustris]WMP15658.1 DMT family transporter [Thiothrix lacustris]